MSAPLRSRFFLLALPVIALAQAPPPEVDRELRARVNQFFQYHVDGEFRKAVPLVAEDTQDAYFAGGKQKLSSFTLDSIQYTDDFTKAVVMITAKVPWQIRLQEHEAVTSMVTSWKIENGKWVWYRDPTKIRLTPMGDSNIEPPKKNSDGTVNIPKNLNDDLLASVTRSILAQSAIDKHEVVLLAEGTSADRVMFSNGAQGVVVLELAGVPEIPGFQARLEKTEVAAGQQTQLMLYYQAPAGSEPQAPFTLEIRTQPFNQVYPVKVYLGKPKEQ